MNIHANEIGISKEGTGSVFTSGSIKSSYDAIVVGAGHNSLTTAAYLAKSGLSVCVLEKNDIVGGGVVSREITAPGFVHDTHATGMILIMANPMIANDELELKSRFGLEFDNPEGTYVSMFDDETWLGTYVDLDKTCESIAKFSQKDAETYRAFVQRTSTLAPLFAAGMFKPPLPFGPFLAMLEQHPLGQDFINSMLTSATDYIMKMFEHEKVRMHFMKWVAEGMIHPDERGTGVYMYFLTAVAHSQEETSVRGGTQALSDSLARCIAQHGGEIHTNTWVRRVLVSDGKTTGVELASGQIVSANKSVVACIHPHVLGDYIEGLDEQLIADARNCELSSFGAINTHWALHEAPSYKCPEINKSLLVECVPSRMELLRQGLDDCRAGRLASDFNAVIAHHTNHDPSRAPDGKHTLYLYCFAPLELRNTGPLGGLDVSEWNMEIRDHYKEWMMEKYSAYCTNMTADNIIASAAESPADMAEWSPSFQKGDIFGIGNWMHQYLGRRPTPALAQYAVPGADGLYLAGPFMHPGGAVTGGGRATAMKILDDMNADISAVMAV
ncbi:MAG: NAD(P)/FAD-dependent oxidoreductase [Pseudomonadota bacterium]